MNGVVHFEIPVDDFEKGKEFYKIFGWEMTEEPGMEYVNVRTVPVDSSQMPTVPGAINGGMMKRNDMVRGPVIAIHVASIEEYVEKAISHGGRLIMPKIEIGEVGFYAYIADPNGNVLGLWEARGKC